MENKICAKCNIDKSLDEFHKNKLGVGGYHSQCKICKNTYKKEYKINNKDKIILYRKKIKHIGVWRSILKSTIKRINGIKNGNTIDILGYSALELKEHIEQLFTEGMNWDNHGEWHVDHIIDVSLFIEGTEPMIVNALSNLRPLWATTREINGVIYEGNLNRNKHRKKKLITII